MAARKIGIIGYLLCMCLFLFLLPCTAQAVATTDAGAAMPTGRGCKMTLSYSKDGVGIENLSVKVYQVASVSENGGYLPKAAFKPLQIDWSNLSTTDQLIVTCTTLESHVLEQNVNADFKKVTDSSGVAVFESLDPGMYFIAETKALYSNKQYIFQSALVSLPAMDDNGIWQHHITVAPKGEVVVLDKPGQEEEIIQFKVVKLWSDAGHQENRPDCIEVEIFRDGRSYQIVNLSNANNWSYGWTAPEDGTQWMVAERNVPPGYIATVEKRDTTFVLTNSSYSDGTDREEGPGTGDSQNLLLYVMAFFISGMALILLSVSRRRGQ